jgi:hypothetical protein
MRKTNKRRSRPSEYFLGGIFQQSGAINCNCLLGQRSRFQFGSGRLGVLSVLAHLVTKQQFAKAGPMARLGSGFSRSPTCNRRRPLFSEYRAFPSRALDRA